MANPNCRLRYSYNINTAWTLALTSLIAYASGPRLSNQSRSRSATDAALPCKQEIENWTKA